MKVKYLKPYNDRMLMETQDHRLANDLLAMANAECHRTEPSGILSSVQSESC